MTSSSSHSSSASGHDQTVFVDVPTELGPYRLTRILGRGGMGEVWQAFDTNLERDVAVKLMRRELLANEEAVRRFGREARAVARLNHSNIVQVYAFGDEKGVLYFVMELVEGETVGDVVKRQTNLTLEAAVLIMLQSVEGLSYASVRGIVHRDIKPSNLMITPDARVKIADFGLAKMIEQDSQVTAAGSTMGSPNYMSPEQARGEEADHRSDIYSLGITFYQMLTGQLPFTAQTPLSVLLMQIQNPLPEPQFLKELADGRALSIIKKMTEKRAGDRYQNYSELAADLAALVPGIHLGQSAYVRTMSMPTPDMAPPPPPPSGGTGSYPPAGGSGPSGSFSGGPATGSMPGAGSAHAISADDLMPPRSELASTRTMESPPPPPPGLPPMPSALEASAGVPPSPPAVKAPRTGPLLAVIALLLVAFVGVAIALVMYRNSLFPVDNSGRLQARHVKTPRPDTGAVDGATETEPLDGRETPEQTPTPTPAAALTPAIYIVPVTIPSAATPLPAATVPPTGVMVMPAPMLTPTPTPVQLAPKYARLGPGASREQLIQVFNESGAPLFTLPAHLQVEYLTAESVAGQSWIRIRHQGQVGFVRAADAEAVVGSVDAGSAQPAPTPGTARPASQRMVMLGTAGAPGKIDIYEDERQLRVLQAVKPGTLLPFIDEQPYTYRVQVPGRTRAGYVQKKICTLQP